MQVLIAAANANFLAANGSFKATRPQMDACLCVFAWRLP